MSAILLPSGRLRYHAYINGVYGPAVGYKLYTYEAGTTTPKTTYADADAATPLANPVVLDALGECAPYGSGSYKLKLTDSSGADVWTQDNVLLSNSVADEEWCGTAGGTANSITISPTVAISSYQTGQRFSFIAVASNSGPVTVAVSGLATMAVTWNGNTALASGDLVMGLIYQIQYDGTRFQLSTLPYLNASSSTSDSTKRLVTSEFLQAVLTARNATTSTTGLVQLAGTTAVNAASPSSSLVCTVEDLRAGNIVSDTAKASTSGTSVDFTGIPSWAKRITIMFSGVSTSGTSVKMVRLGSSGGFDSTGYLSSTVFLLNGAGVAGTNYTDGFALSGTSAGDVQHGSIVLTKISGNTWISSGNISFSSGAAFGVVAGSKTTSGTLDRVRVTTQGGADTFDAGSINIIYE